MRPLRWGALAAMSIGLAFPATALARTTQPTSSELCGNVSATVGSSTVTSPIPPPCTAECFIAIGPVNVHEGGLAVNAAPCVEG